MVIYYTAHFGPKLGVNAFTFSENFAENNVETRKGLVTRTRLIAPHFRRSDESA